MNKYKQPSPFSGFNVKNTLARTFLNHYSKKLVYSFDNMITYR